MSFSNTPADVGSLPPGRYAIQILARNDPPPTGRFAVERVGRRYSDDPVRAEFALCVPMNS